MYKYKEFLNRIFDGNTDIIIVFSKFRQLETITGFGQSVKTFHTDFIKN